MSIDTDASELSRRRINELHRLDAEYQMRYYPQKGNIFNGSTKLITSLLAIMNILTAAAIIGGIVMYAKVNSLDDKVTLIIEGKIRVLSHD
jgi:hypothetical protein